MFDSQTGGGITRNHNPIDDCEVRDGRGRRIFLGHEPSVPPPLQHLGAVQLPAPVRGEPSVLVVAINVGGLTRAPTFPTLRVVAAGEPPETAGVTAAHHDGRAQEFR